MIYMPGVYWLSCWLWADSSCVELCASSYLRGTQKPILALGWGQVLWGTRGCSGTYPSHAVEDAFLFLAEQAMIAKVCEELQNMAVHHIYLPFFFLFKKKISVFWVTAHVVTQQEPLPCVELKYGQLPAPEKPAASISSCKSLEIM